MPDDYTSRFKITFYDSPSSPFALYYRERRSFFRADRWTYLQNFETRDLAVAFYDKIKDLPEYLA